MPALSTKASCFPMVTTHNLGYPRIGAQRELKFALEAYWKGQSSRDELLAVGAQLRQRHWASQASLDWAPVGDFSFYDQVLDTSFMLGNLPQRVRGFHGDMLDNYFRVARGRSAQGDQAHGGCCAGVAAGEMTKWFDTNYCGVPFLNELNWLTPLQCSTSVCIGENKCELPRLSN